MAYFERKGCVQRNLYLNCDYEKVFKASDIIWFVSSACHLRRQWPEFVGRVNRAFCFTGAICVLQGAIFRRSISAYLVTFSFVQKHFIG